MDLSLDLRGLLKKGRVNSRLLKLDIAMDRKKSIPTSTSMVCFLSSAREDRMRKNRATEARIEAITTIDRLSIGSKLLMIYLYQQFDIDTRVLIGYLSVERVVRNLADIRMNKSISD